MTTFLLFVVIGLLVYIISNLEKQKKEKPADEKKQASIKQTLVRCKGRFCEITVKEPLASVDIINQIKGILIDSDDEWVLISYSKRKKTVQKLFRISLICDIKELSAHGEDEVLPEQDI